MKRDVGNGRGVIIGGGELRCRFRVGEGVAVVGKSDTAKGAALVGVVERFTGLNGTDKVRVRYSTAYAILRKGV